MTTKTKLAPLNIGIKNNQLMCDQNGSDFIDLLGDLGWDYQCMTQSGKETYDEIMMMFGVLEEGETWLEEN